MWFLSNYSGCVSTCSRLCSWMFWSVTTLPNKAKQNRNMFSKCVCKKANAQTLLVNLILVHLFRCLIITVQSGGLTTWKLDRIVPPFPVDLPTPTRTRYERVSPEVFKKKNFLICWPLSIHHWYLWTWEFEYIGKLWCRVRCFGRPQTICASRVDFSEKRNFKTFPTQIPCSYLFLGYRFSHPFLQPFSRWPQRFQDSTCSNMLLGGLPWVVFSNWKSVNMYRKGM